MKIQRGIFKGDALSPLVIVIAMMSLSHIYRKMHRHIQTTQIAGKNQPPNVYWRYQTICQNFKRFGNPNRCSEDIGMEFCIDRCAILIMTSVKGQMTEEI